MNSVIYAGLDVHKERVSLGAITGNGENYSRAVDAKMGSRIFW